MFHLLSKSAFGFHLGHIRAAPATLHRPSPAIALDVSGMNADTAAITRTGHRRPETRIHYAPRERSYFETARMSRLMEHL
jgi:hypothetical protein